MFKYKLTIAVLTFNRAEKLQKALLSCLNSSLPSETQFVIVNNGSTDDTDIVVNSFIQQYSNLYDIRYESEKENLGAGSGRNICFHLSEGEYVYFMDDDAEISSDCYQTFFINSIKYLDRNREVATLTTYIIDEVFGDRTGTLSKRQEVDGLRTVYRFHEGSVFIRKAYFSDPLYMNVFYGGEGIPISMKSMDDGYYNVYYPEVYINHYPSSNKWNDDRDYINMLGASNIYVLKKLQYPRICTPILYLVYMMRIRRYHIKDKSLVKKFRIKNKEFSKENSIERIKLITVIKSFFEFGMTTF